MKKYHFVIILFVSISINGYTCTIIPDSFCKTILKKSNELIVSGVIISKDIDGIDLEVIDVFRGEELRSTIRIWDGTDFDCNGNFSMSASNIGQLNDSIVIVLPKIVAAENTWDVIGDYRRPDPYSYTSKLRLENGIAKGLITGDAIAPPEFNTYSINYDRLLEVITSNWNCTDLISSNKELLPIDNIKYNNPVSDELNIELDDSHKIDNISIYTINGRRVNSVKINSQKYVTIDMENEIPGIYIVQLVNTNRQSRYIKILKT